ncbi:DUF397 domain-containing protein [Streptomyces varsoviensis]|uniref:DUF397 domain-containing protein n=1 Tax=Streptomyces varsoviensis TaxID=67373 RepID=UPI000997F3B0|nr:DUF397 domain-containing protein [Streptomyces varsoviensis]
MAAKSPRWVKSSYSSNGGQCVEWAPAEVRGHGAVPVRDSKNPAGPVLVIGTVAWGNFVAFVRTTGI